MRTGQVEEWFDVNRYLGPIKPGEVTVSPEGGHDDQRGAGPIGYTVQGLPILRVGSRTPGTPFSVVIVSAPMQPTVIYRGIAGQTGGFDPTPGAVSDQHGVWFGDFGGKVLWRYTQASGLQKAVTLQATGRDTSVQVSGACS